MDDVLAVLDAVGSQQASILGISEGGSLAALFAATHPERTARIILYGTLTHYDADAQYQAGAGDGTIAGFVEAVSRGWGMRSDWAVQLWAPSMAGDEPFTQWLAKYARQSVSRGAIPPLLSAFYAYDLVDVFPAVRVPTLVLHRRDDGLVPVRHGRQIASQIPEARFVELEGADHLPFVGDAVTGGRGRARDPRLGRAGHRPGRPRSLPAPDHRVGTGDRGGPGTGRRRSQCRGP